jgi:hypothetical protein
LVAIEGARRVDHDFVDDHTLRSCFKGEEGKNGNQQKGNWAHFEKKLPNVLNFWANA